MLNKNTAQIIQAVTTPIGFFSLIVLVIEGILAGLALIASPQDQTFIIKSIIGILVAVIVIVTIMFFTKSEYFKPGRPSQSSTDQQYDIFISAPMASFTSDEQYQQERHQMLELINSLHQNCRFGNIFYAGSQLESQTDFDSDVALAADHDFHAIDGSRYFLLIYPERLASSVLVEAGYAIAKEKPSVFFVRNRQDLPYLLKNLHGIRNVEIYEYNNLENIIDLIIRNGSDIFPQIN